LGNFKVSPKYIARFILATDEMNNNAIEYWSLSHENNYLRVNIVREWKNLSVVIEVEDSWNWKSAKTAEQMEEYRNERAHEDFKHHTSIRGRGLFLIIIKIVDELYFRNTNNWGLIVGFKKDLLSI
jgi:anti-sigma regulatory factor (Ser/Thr protein kinase)